MLRHLLTVAATLLTLSLTSPAAAYVVEVTTSVSLENPGERTARDADQLKDALRSAVDEVLKEAIAFKPTLIVLTAARVVGDRLYVRLLIADQDGERTVRDLHGDAETQQDAPDQPI